MTRVASLITLFLALIVAVGALLALWDSARFRKPLFLLFVVLYGCVMLIFWLNYQQIETNPMALMNNLGGVIFGALVLAGHRWIRIKEAERIKRRKKRQS